MSTTLTADVSTAARPWAGGGARLALPPIPDWHRDERLPCKSDPNRWYSDALPIQRDAAQTCRTRCPRVAECLAHVQAHPETWGVWGGTTPNDRRGGGGGLRTPGCDHPVEKMCERPGTRLLRCFMCENEREQARVVAAGGTPLAARQREAVERQERVMAAYHALADRGLSYYGAARALGMSPDAFKAILRRARNEGDPRAVSHQPAEDVEAAS